MPAGGFTDVLLRGDTDFALTTAFDRWTTAGVRFVFGYDATATRVRWGQSAPPDLYEALVRRTERTLATAPRQRPANVKDRIVTDRGFKKITTVSEALVDFDYQPTTCTRPYRVVALKKHLSVERGEQVLFDDIRYFFDITNDRALSCHEVVHEARQRCDQENLIAQLKGGVRALHAPVNTLHANWAYMVMAALAWSLKAWVKSWSFPSPPAGGPATRRSSDSCCEWTSAPSSARSSMCLAKSSRAGDA